MPIDATIPPDNVEASKPAIRSNFAATKAKIDTMPESYTAMAGEVIAVNAGATGPTAVSQVGTANLKFGNLPVQGFKQRIVQVTGSTALTDAAHGGAVIECLNTTAIQIVLNKDATPTVGVSDGFICKIRRAGTGAVQLIVGAGMTNRNPNSHQRIQQFRFATVEVSGNNVYYDGYTES
jgi:hypothetical protein